ncbi:hypothetical protein GS493_25015 [Rhodococcus hoagii]|nr:hypothetical protein [Prescottella equi]
MSTSARSPGRDNKFSALNTGVVGGSFIYVPPGVHVDIPLQAYFRINTENGSVRADAHHRDEGASVHYVEGCTAPIYKSDSLHSAVVEIIVKKGGHCRYTTIQKVEQRLQPGDQAHQGRGGRLDGVDRRQHRLKVTESTRPCG